MKKLLLALGTIATVVAPITSVIACSNSSVTSNDEINKLKDSYRKLILKYGKSDKVKVTLLTLVMNLKTAEDTKDFLAYKDMKDVMEQMRIEEEEGGLTEDEVVNYIRSEVSKASGEYIIENNTIDSSGTKLADHGEKHAIVLGASLKIGDHFTYRTINPISQRTGAIATYTIKSINDLANPTEVTFNVNRLAEKGVTTSEITYKVTKATDGIVLEDHNTGKYYYNEADAKALTAEDIRTYLENDSNIVAQIKIDNEDLENAWITALSLILN